MCEFFWNFWVCLDFSVNFGLNFVFAIFCIVRGQKKSKKSIYVSCDHVEFAVYLVLMLELLFSILILFLELGCFGIIYFLLFLFSLFVVVFFVLDLIMFCLCIVFSFDSLLCFESQNQKSRKKKPKNKKNRNPTFLL